MQIIEDLNNVLVSERLSLREALALLDRNGLQILLLKDDADKLTGILTDGDIRRFILNDGSLDTLVREISNSNFIKLEQENLSKANNILQKHDINHLPILDNNGCTQALALRNEITQRTQVPIVIVAGGMGSRLLPLSNIIPKPLMPVGEMTMLEKIMENFYNQGLNDFKVIVNFKKDLIKTYMQEVEHPYNIEFIEEENFSGTIGGLSLLKDDLEGPFLVSNCDILADLSYQALLDWHDQRKADLTILGVRKRIDIPYGVVKVDTKSYVTNVQEKPFINNMIISGVYVMNSEILKLIPSKDEFGMDQLINKLLSEGFNVTCYPIESGWYDIGQFDEYRKLLNFLGDTSA